MILVEDGSEEDLNLFITILNYLLVPPYLRRKLIPLTKELSFAGALPPLNIPTHNPSNKKPEINDVREGVVRTAFGRKGKVFFGYKRYCLMLSEREIFPGERVLLKITSLDPLKCVEEEPSKTEIYIGYRVFHSGVNDLSHTLRKLCGECINIMTSKLGKAFTYREARNFLKEVKSSKCLTLFFGNHEKDFNEIIPKEAFEALGINHVYNFIKEQGVYSVRTDEALLSVLSALNFVLNS